MHKERILGTHVADYMNYLNEVRRLGLGGFGWGGWNGWAAAVMLLRPNRIEP